MCARVKCAPTGAATARKSAPDKRDSPPCNSSERPQVEKIARPKGLPRFSGVVIVRAVDGHGRIRRPIENSARDLSGLRSCP